MIDSMEGESPSVSQHQTGWKRIKNALHFSLEGLRACYTGEEAFRQEVDSVERGVELASSAVDSNSQSAESLQLVLLVAHSSSTHPRIQTRR